MAQYIDKSALVAEIERRNVICKKVALDLRTQENKDYYQGKAEAYKEVLDILNTLEVKEVKEPAASDKDMVEEIIKQLKRVEQDYHIDLTREMEWLRSTQLIGWKPISEIPTKHWANNHAISPLYLVRCGEEEGVPILGYSHYSFATKKWMDCHQATVEGIHKVTEWSEIIFHI